MLALRRKYGLGEFSKKAKAKVKGKKTKALSSPKKTTRWSDGEGPVRGGTRFVPFP